MDPPAQVPEVSVCPKEAGPKFSFMTVDSCLFGVTVKGKSQRNPSSAFGRVPGIFHHQLLDGADSPVAQGVLSF